MKTKFSKTKRLRILWIPHTSWLQCKSQRPWFLIKGLAERFEQHIVTWAARPSGTSRSYYLNPLNHLKAFASGTHEDEAGFVHDTGVHLPVIQAFKKGYPSSRTVALAQWNFQRNIRKLQVKWKFDAMVVSASHHFTGFPPVLDGVPQIFDYVDYSGPAVEGPYVSNSNSVISVSQFLRDRVKKEYGRECLWIPNGLDLTRIKNGDGNRGRKKWHLEDKKVVSLIGLTCSPRLYFIDALQQLKSEFPDLVLLAAGSGTIAANIEAKARRMGVPAIMTGWLDYEHIPDLYAASDVGLYPGDDTAYFDGACPLKVLEYAGAEVPTVVNQSAELRKLNFPSMLIRPATVEGFVDGIREALRKKPVATPEISQFDWPLLVKRFGDEVERVAETNSSTN